MTDRCQPGDRDDGGTAIGVGKDVSVRIAARVVEHELLEAFGADDGLGAMQARCDGGKSASGGMGVGGKHRGGVGAQQTLRNLLRRFSEEADEAAEGDLQQDTALCQGERPGHVIVDDRIAFGVGEQRRKPDRLEGEQRVLGMDRPAAERQFDEDGATAAEGAGFAPFEPIRKVWARA